MVIFQSRFNVKIHVQVHFTIASQFYVHVNVKLHMHVFMCWKKRRSSKELSNNISDWSGALGTGILSDLLLGGWRSQTVSGKSAKYYLIFALLTHHLPSSQPLAYIVAQLYRASPVAYIIARVRLAFFKARTLLHYQLCRHNTYTRLKN